MSYYNKKIEDLYKLIVEEEKQIYGINGSNNNDIIKILLNNKENFVLLINEFINKDKIISSNDIERVTNIPNMVRHNFKEIDYIYKTKNEKVYYLLEHQETIDDTIVYRMLSYTINVMKNIYENKMVSRKEIKFPTIIPIVLYTGKNKWDCPQKIEDLQEQITKGYNLFSFEYLLINLGELNKSEQKEEKIKKQMVEIMIKNGASINEICKYIGISKNDIRKIMREK